MGIGRIENEERKTNRVPSMSHRNDAEAQRRKDLIGSVRLQADSDRASHKSLVGGAKLQLMPSPTKSV